MFQLQLMFSAAIAARLDDEHAQQQSLLLARQLRVDAIRQALDSQDPSHQQPGMFVLNPDRNQSHLSSTLENCQSRTSPMTTMRRVLLVVVTMISMCFKQWISIDRDHLVE
jgi:hypothetical protein